jgi:hypothetical protein
LCSTVAISSAEASRRILTNMPGMQSNPAEAVKGALAHVSPGSPAQVYARVPPAL